MCCPRRDECAAKTVQRMKRVEVADLHTRVVRALGSSVTHVIEAPTSQYVDMFFTTSFIGVLIPVATRCGAVLHCSFGVAVCMEAGTPVKCSRCRRITGITTAPAENGVLPAVGTGSLHP
jgi:hypothetical protein